MKIQVEIFNYEDNCFHRTIIASKRVLKESESVINHPTIVLVSGKGVISKSYNNNENIIQRVKNNDSLYYSCDEENSVISFVRKDQVDSEIKNYTNIILVKIVDKATDDIINKTISVFYSDIFTVQNIVKYNDSSRKIISHLIRRFEMPFMISIFITLLANYFVNSYFSEKNSILQIELINSKRIAKKMDSQTRSTQNILSEIATDRSSEISVIIDKLSAQIPNSITLNYFAVDPVVGRVEKGKALRLIKNTIIIKGETASANDITKMTNLIETTDFSKDVKIKNIKQVRDSDTLEFEIEIIY